MKQTHKDKVLMLLLDNVPNSLSPKEISQKTKIILNSLTVTLLRLKQEKLVNNPSYGKYLINEQGKIQAIELKNKFSGELDETKSAEVPKIDYIKKLEDNTISIDASDVPIFIKLLKKYGGRKGINKTLDELKELL